MQARLTGIGETLEEAAADLGAKPFKVMTSITLPRLAPGMLSGWLLAFTLSLDDLVIASFVTGPGANTLPILIFSRIRLGLRPDINALATIIILFVAVLVAIAAYIMFRQQKRELLDQQLATKNTIAANKIISGTILKINDQHITVDIGYKSEGQIPKEEFLNTGSSDDLKTGQVIEVFVEKLEDREGNVKISHEKAIKMKSWEKLQKLYDNKERVKGFIVGKAKAGLYVKIMGTNAFLPLSQIDVRPVRDVSLSLIHI